MSTQTDQELHVAAELELFEKQGKNFRCRGGQEQDLAKVVAKIEGAIRGAKRSAERSERQAAAAEVAGNEEDAKARGGDALGHRAREKALDSLAATVLDGASKMRAAVKGDVQTVHVATLLIQSGRTDLAIELDKHARVSCGQDLRETIAALPRPCDTEPYVCPRCGREGHASKIAHEAEVATEQSAKAAPTEV